MNVSTVNFLNRIVMVLIGAAIVGLGVAAYGDSVRLNDQAAAPGPKVTLGQIAELEGAHARSLADTVVAELSATQKRTTITLDTVRRALDQRGVNWADLSLRGYAACQVIVPVKAASPVEGDSADGVVSNPRDEVTLSTRMTLRDLLIDRIERVAGSPRAQLKINFDQRDQKQLARSIFGQRYEVEPHTQHGLGRLLFRVRRYELDQPVEQFTLAVDVSHRVLAVVATANIQRGGSFSESNCEVRQVMIDDADMHPIQDPDLLLGQTAVRQLRAGTVVQGDDVRSAVLVKRGELVSVRCVSGNLVIRTTARAIEDGAMGETIRLRNERSREEFSAAVTGLRKTSTSLNADNAEGHVEKPVNSLKQAALP